MKRAEENFRAHRAARWCEGEPLGREAHYRLELRLLCPPNLPPPLVAGAARLPSVKAKQPQRPLRSARARSPRALQRPSRGWQRPPHVAQLLPHRRRRRSPVVRSRRPAQSSKSSAANGKSCCLGSRRWRCNRRILISPLSIALRGTDSAIRAPLRYCFTSGASGPRGSAISGDSLGGWMEMRGRHFSHSLSISG